MSAVIIYASKHGATKRLAEKIQAKLGSDAAVYDVKEAKMADLSKYDTVILGSSVYVGQAQKSLKAWMEKNLDALKGKKLALFLCCGNKEQKEAQLASAFPAALREKALYLGALGSAVDFNKLGFLEKTVYKKVTGVSESYEAFDEGEIDALAKALK